jgi:hypothetical protein
LADTQGIELLVKLGFELIVEASSVGTVAGNEVEVPITFTRRADRSHRLTELCDSVEHTKATEEVEVLSLARHGTVAGVLRYILFF